MYLMYTKILTALFFTLSKLWRNLVCIIIILCCIFIENWYTIHFIVLIKSFAGMIFVLFVFLFFYIVVDLVKRNSLEINKKRAVDNFLDHCDVAELSKYKHILPKFCFKSNCRIVKHNAKCVYCKKNTLYKIQESSTTFICINPSCKHYLLERNANNLNLHTEDVYLRKNGKL